MNLRTRRRYTGPSAATLLLLEDRSRGRCELCGETAVHTHHRRPRGMGSSRDEATNSPSNLLRLCRRCHGEIESYRAEALANGWLVSRYADPADVPVLVDCDSRWVYLTPEGQVSDTPPGQNRCGATELSDAEPRLDGTPPAGVTSTRRRLDPNPIPRKRGPW